MGKHAQQDDDFEGLNLPPRRLPTKKPTGRRAKQETTEAWVSPDAFKVAPLVSETAAPEPSPTPDEDSTVTTPQKKSRKGLKITGAVLASAIILGGATTGGFYWNLNHRIQEKAVDIGEAATPAVAAEPKTIEETVEVDEFQGAFSVLLVGNDDADGKREHALNDVNMLLRVSADHKKARAISIPRDMYVDAPECTDPDTGETKPAEENIKMNTSLSRGGLKCVVDTVRQLTGEEVDYAAMIGFNGVTQLSNAVGGVPVCVTSDIDDSRSGLKMTAGEHTIKGEQALAFLRTRHGVGDGSDLARISNQQVFLSSLMKTLKSKDTLSDPNKVYGIANAVADNMTLSTNLASIPTLASMAYSLKDIPLKDITFMQYPTSYAYVDGIQGVVPKEEAAAEMVAAVYSDKEITLTGGTAPGSIGAVEKEEKKESKKVTAKPEDGTATAAPTDSTVTAKPSKKDETVELSEDVTGMNASQSTCSRGFGDF